MLFSVALGSCGGGSQYSDKVAAYKDAVGKQITGFADRTAPAFLEYLESSGDKASTSEFAEHDEGTRKTFRDQVCEETAKLAKDAGSGSKKSERLDQAQNEASILLGDLVALGSIRGALDRPAESRDQLLNRLHIGAAEDGKAPVPGLDALKEPGLVGADGHFVDPGTSGPEHDRFEDWFAQARAFRGAVSTITGGPFSCDY